MIVAIIINISKNDGEFPGGLVVRIQHFLWYGLGLISSQGIEILQVTPCGKKKRERERKAWRGKIICQKRRRRRNITFRNEVGAVLSV